MPVSPEELSVLQAQQPLDGVPQQAFLDPLEVLDEVTLQYMDFVFQVKNDQTLDLPVKSRILLELAQSLNYMVPLLVQSKQLDKSVDPMEQQKHEMELQKRIIDAQIQQQKLQQQEEIHQQKLVHNEQKHQQRLKQQEQAQQLKQRQNNSKSAKSNKK